METRLQQIKQIHEAGFIKSKKLSSGTVNQNYLITSKQGQWVVRLNKPHVTGVDRNNEAYILNLISQYDIAPKIIINNPEQGYLITEFNPQKIWNKQSCLVNQIKLIDKLKLIHQISLPAHFTSLATRIRQYDKIIDQNGISINRKKLNLIIDKLADLGFFDNNKTLIHSDLNPNNLIGTRPLQIIDWEFACQGHPIFDCAVFIYYNQLSPLQSQPISAYCQQFKNGLKILPISQSLVAILFNMWRLINSQLPFQRAMNIF